MAYWNGTDLDEYKDFLEYGDSADIADGWGGSDVFFGWQGDDLLWGGNGMDTVYGEDGFDKLYGGDDPDYLSGGADGDELYGGQGHDDLYGDAGFDALYGGPGVDDLYGGLNGDSFIFYTDDTGTYTQGQADTIWDFDEEDIIWLKDTYGFVGDTHYPGDGELSIWQLGTDWVVTYNSSHDLINHDILVKGADPHGDIAFF
jgi:Ca2+-binding RTX toxin-like protein